jgi:hypothetical protein
MNSQPTARCIDCGSPINAHAVRYRGAQRCRGCATLLRLGRERHLDPVWLRQKYEAEGLSTYDIAALVGRDPKRIYEKLREFGIPTRPRGHNLVGQDNFMAQPGAVTPTKGRTFSIETRRKSADARRGNPHMSVRGARNGMYGKRGAANPRYVDGSSPERQRLYAQAEWMTFVRTIYGRDNYRCVRCGRGKRGPRSLHAHHLASWAGNPALRYEATNVVTLCRPCHEWVHSAANIGGALVVSTHSSPAFANSAFANSAST